MTKIEQAIEKLDTILIHHLHPQSLVAKREALILLRSLEPQEVHLAIGLSTHSDDILGVFATQQLAQDEAGKPEHEDGDYVGVGVVAYPVQGEPQEPTCEKCGGTGVEALLSPHKPPTAQAIDKMVETIIPKPKEPTRHIRSMEMEANRKAGLNKESKPEITADIEALEAKLLASESQNYCKMCGNTLDGYVPPKPETTIDLMQREAERIIDENRKPEVDADGFPGFMRQVTAFVQTWSGSLRAEGLEWCNHLVALEADKGMQAMGFEKAEARECPHTVSVVQEYIQTYCPMCHTEALEAQLTTSQDNEKRIREGLETIKSRAGSMGFGIFVNIAQAYLHPVVKKNVTTEGEKKE